MPPPIVEERVSLEFDSVQFAQECKYYFCVYHRQEKVLHSDEPDANRRPSFRHNRCDIVVDSSATVGSHANDVTVELFVFQKDDDGNAKETATKLGSTTYALDRDLEKLRNGEICITSLSLTRRQGTTGKEVPVGMMKLVSSRLTTVRHRESNTCMLEIVFASGFPEDSIAQARVMCESDQGGEWVVDHMWRNGQFHTARTSNSSLPGVSNLSSAVAPWWVGRTLTLLVPQTLGSRQDASSHVVELSVLNKSNGHIIARVCLSFAGVEFQVQKCLCFSWEHEEFGTCMLYATLELRSSMKLDYRLFSKKLGRERLGVKFRHPPKKTQVQFNLPRDGSQIKGTPFPGDPSEYTFALLSLEPSTEGSETKEEEGEKPKALNWKSLFTPVKVKGVTQSVAVAMQGEPRGTSKVCRLGSLTSETLIDVGPGVSKGDNEVEEIWCEPPASNLAMSLRCFTLLPSDADATDLDGRQNGVDYIATVDTAKLLPIGVPMTVNSTMLRGEATAIDAPVGQVRAYSNEEMQRLTKSSKGNEEEDTSEEAIQAVEEKKSEETDEQSVEEEKRSEGEKAVRASPDGSNEVDEKVVREEQIETILTRSDVSHLELDKTMSFITENENTASGGTPETTATNSQLPGKMEEALRLQEEAMKKQDQVIASQLEKIQLLNKQLHQANEQQTHLRLLISQKDSAVSSLVEEVNKRSSAIRKCGAEIVELRKKCEDLKADNTRLRKLEAKRKAVEAGLLPENDNNQNAKGGFQYSLDTREVELAGEQDLRRMVMTWHEHYNTEVKRNYKITRHLGSMAKLRGLVRKLQDKISSLELTNLAQNKLINELQDDKAKVKTLKLTIETQERVIDKLEHMIEQQIIKTDAAGTARTNRRQSSMRFDALEGDSALLERIRELEDHIHELEEATHQDSNLVDKMVNSKEKNYEELEKQLILNAKQFATKLADLNFEIMELKERLGEDSDEDDSE